MKGLKRLRNSETIEDSTEVEGSVGDSMAPTSELSLAGLGLEKPDDMEVENGEACFELCWLGAAATQVSKGFLKAVMVVPLFLGLLPG